MRTAVYVALLLLCNLSRAQTVPSSCAAPDSVLKKYTVDADYMAHQRMLQNNYADSIIIPQGWSDTLLHAMVAVYNATTLPVRDTVVNIYNIHNLNTDWLTNLALEADSMAGYMMQMKTNTFPTGFAPFDDLMTKYHLKLKVYVPNVFQGPPNAHALMLVSDSTYNMVALADSFSALPGAFGAGAASFNIHPDSLAISDTLKPDHMVLDYRYSWDCGSVSGCTYSHIWHFKVKYTCDSVTYLGSSGDPLPTVSVKDAEKLSFRIYPNPVKDILTIERPKGETLQYAIFNLQGQAVQTGSANSTITVSGLPSGSYFLQLDAGRVQTTLRFLKE